MMAAYPPWIIERCIERGSPVVVRLLLDGGVMLAPGTTEPLDAFEAWLVARTLNAARSEAFRGTAEYEYLQAEWEQGR